MNPDGLKFNAPWMHGNPSTVNPHQRDFGNPSFPPMITYGQAYPTSGGPIYPYGQWQPMVPPMYGAYHCLPPAFYPTGQLRQFMVDEEQTLVGALADGDEFSALDGLNGRSYLEWENHYLKHKVRLDDMVKAAKSRSSATSVTHCSDEDISAESHPTSSGQNKKRPLESDSGSDLPPRCSPPRVSAERPNEPPPSSTARSRNNTHTVIALSESSEPRSTHAPAPKKSRTSASKEDSHKHTQDPKLFFPLTHTGSSTSSHGPDSARRQHKPVSSKHDGQRLPTSNVTIRAYNVQGAPDITRLPRDRSPRPPSSVVRRGRGYAFTEEDKKFFRSTLLHEIHKNRNVGRDEIIRKLCAKAPHHTVNSWKHYWDRLPGINELVANSRNNGAVALNADVDTGIFEESAHNASSDDDAEQRASCAKTRQEPWSQDEEAALARHIASLPFKQAGKMEWARCHIEIPHRSVYAIAAYYKRHSAKIDRLIHTMGLVTGSSASSAKISASDSDPEAEWPASVHIYGYDSDE
ncbi:hypothetical protein PLICRDRAFT_520238 [Plicaturopsis crispa FD-325 SS-3]|nr:hypothetical protein PLICRDRAFT_520238 [Plicaturopsis crispa FD-325 SS-3]